MDALRSSLRRKATNENIEVYGDLDDVEEQRLLEPIREDNARVLLATNAAENSVTLPVDDTLIDELGGLTMKNLKKLPHKKTFLNP